MESWISFQEDYREDPNRRDQASASELAEKVFPKLRSLFLVTLGSSQKIWSNDRK